MKNTEKMLKEIEFENFSRFCRRITPITIFGKQWDELVNEALEDVRTGELNYQHCWIWTSTCFRRPRAKGKEKLQPWFWITDPITRKRKQVYARRYAWYLLYGYHLRHGLEGQWLGQYRCNLDACVNPAHGSILSHSTYYSAQFENDMERMRKRIYERMDTKPTPSTPPPDDFDPLQAEIEANKKR